MTEDATDGRLKRDLGVVRRTRSTPDDRPESGGTSVAERLDAFREQQYNNALPDLPPIPGYHTIWLTTTNPRDSITHRLSLGYELIKADDFPGFASVTLRSGEYEGCIGVEEMIAAKLPEELFQGYMKIAHYDRPKEQEDILNRNIEELRHNAERDGGRIVDADDGDENGMAELRRSTPAPRHFS